MENCQRNSWIAAGIVGLLVLIYLMSVHEYGLFGALIWGVVFAVVIGIFLPFVLCRGSGDAQASTGAATPAPPQVDRTPEPTPVAVAEPEPLAAAETPEPETVPEPVAAATGGEDPAKPEALSEPRGGRADDLKKIKGVGPKLETVLNELGFYHFDQIAGWSAAGVAWVDENIGGITGRVSRDDWVGQAKTLAAGGTTEFAKKVDKGDVY